MNPLPGGARAAWLLTRLRLLRLVNLAGAALQRKPKPGTSRPATAGKRRGAWIVPLVVALMMVLAFANMAYRIVLNMQCELTAASACHAQAAEAGMRVAAAELHAAPFAPALAAGLTMYLSLLWLVALLLPLGSRELGAPDWDLEWLVTLPVRRQVLLWARVLERAVANPTGMLVLWPTTLMIAWHAGLRWTAPPAALAVTLALLVLAALGRTVADTGLRLALPPSQLRNLQAAISVAAMPLTYLAISLSMPGPGITMGWAHGWPQWTLWTPPGVVVQLLDARTLPAAAAFAGLLLLQAGALLWAGMALLARQLADGVVASGARESLRHVKRKSAGRLRLPGTPLQRRELYLLGRDRNFLVQSLLIPLVILGSQMLFTGTLTSLAELGSNQALLASIAFGLGSYMLALSAFQTINTEGHALWLLFTFPRALERMLLEKALLWAALALVYPAAVIGIGLWYAPAVDVHLLARIVLVAAGIPMFSLVAVALGVRASDPLAQEAQARVRPTYLYLYMLLAGVYGYALYTTEWSHRLAVIVLVIALALALWQKARDHLPYLLDPAAAPPPRVAAADGMLAALLFFAVQGIAVLLLHAGDGDGQSAPTLTDLAIGLAIAGAVVFGLLRLYYWRTRTAGVPMLLHGSFGGAVLLGATCALPAIVAGALWMHAVRALGLPLPSAGGDIALPLLLAIACVAAPLCEEFIFRGLIFGGLRRSLPLLPAALAGAALFAVVHPPLSMLPVFVLGLCTAYAYERGKALLAPVVAHAVYNGAMIALQMG